MPVTILPDGVTPEGLQHLQDGDGLLQGQQAVALVQGNRQRDQGWIAAHIPHQGSMCLLDRVLSWDENQLLCRAVSHRDPANPLRARNRLGAVNGIEYAAQAMAVHGALLAPAASAPRAGFLASVRGVTLLADRLDDIAGDLAVQATRFSGDGNNVLYDFSIMADGRLLLQGRAAVVLDAGNGQPFMAVDAAASSSAVVPARAGAGPASAVIPPPEPTS